MEPLLILPLVFLTFFLGVYGLVMRWHAKWKVRDRVHNPELTLSSTILKQRQEAGFIREKILQVLSSSGKWGLRDLEKISKVREQLIQAGFRGLEAMAVYFGLRAVCAFVLPVPYLLLLIIRAKISLMGIIPAFCLSALGFVLPALFLSSLVSRRQNRIDRALPDVIDLFIICMEAGLSLNATVNRVAEEIQGVHKDFYDELQITAAQLTTGLPWDEAFEGLGRRTGVQSVRSLVALMIQSEKLGTSIAQALRTHSDFTRTQRALRAEERAAKLPVKMIFPLVILILPAMFIVTVGPAFMHIKTILRLFR